MRITPRSPRATRVAGWLLVAACACVAVAHGPTARAQATAEALAPGGAADALPRLVSAIVQKGPTRSRLTISFAPVSAATAYNLQASKALTFTRLAVDATTEGSPFHDLFVPPGVYFVRARAITTSGPGPFGPVEVVNALTGGLQMMNGGSETPAASALVSATPVDPAARASGSAGVASATATALEPSVATTPGSTPPALAPGALASTIAGAAEAPADPASALPAPLSQQDLAALGPLRARYEALRSDLQQIELLRQALAASATTVMRQLAGTRDARESAELVNELASLQAARREIDGEIERTLLELGRILAQAPQRP